MESVNVLSSRLIDNKIINGGMRIDQRNGGNALVSGASSIYTVDRWRQERNVTATISTQRLTATPPPGLSHYLALSVTTGVSVGAAQYHEWLQIIESSLVTDTRFGTADAKKLGLSFWVRSGTTGLTSGSLRNIAGTRSYVFTFNIDVANTWEYKEITIPGDITGTWNLNDDSQGSFILCFAHSSGTDYRTAPGVWTSGLFIGAPASNNLTAVTGSTFWLSGVNLVLGTPRPFLPRGQAVELALCQRYYEKSYDVDASTAAITFSGSTRWISGAGSSSFCPVAMKVKKRAHPTVVTYSPVTGTANRLRQVDFANDKITSILSVGQHGFTIFSNDSINSNADHAAHWTADSEF